MNQNNGDQFLGNWKIKESSNAETGMPVDQRFQILEHEDSGQFELRLDPLVVHGCMLDWNTSFTLEDGKLVHTFPEARWILEIQEGRLFARGIPETHSEKAGEWNAEDDGPDPGGR